MFLTIFSLRMRKVAVLLVTTSDQKFDTTVALSGVHFM